MEQVTRSGYDKLWAEMSYLGWLTMPRVLMHEMPDEWQSKMAALIEEFDDHWEIPKKYWAQTSVSMKRNGKFIALPDWVCNYRHPDKAMFETWKRK